MAEAKIEMEEVIQLNAAPMRSNGGFSGDTVDGNTITFHRVTSTHEKTAKSPTTPATRKSTALDAHTSLQRAKDHAQITASTSMSIVHVALLKQLLDSSANAHKYYYVCLALVIGALVLQILAGFIALYVAFLRRYFRKYKNNVVSDCCSILFPCSCRKKNKNRFDIDELFKLDMEPKDEEPIPKENNKDCKCCTCCPWGCVNKHFFYGDHDIRDIQAELTHKLIEIEIETADYEERLHGMNEQITETEARLNATLPRSLPNMQPHYTAVGPLRNKLQHLESERNTLVREYQEVKVLQARSDILRKHIEEIKTQLVLKQAEFWQYSLNCLLYVVFVLNAFTLGFGAAASES